MSSRDMIWILISLIIALVVVAGGTWFTIHQSNSSDAAIEAQIDKEGAEAFKMGISPEANPYQGASGIRYQYPQWWLSGWMKAKGVKHE